MKRVSHLYLIKACPKCSKISPMYPGEGECIHCAVHEEYTRSIMMEAEASIRDALRPQNIWEGDWDDNDRNPKRGA